MLTVHAPAGIGSKNAVSKHTFPTGITEGERLIALGSYSAAVAMIAAALEEVIISSLGETRPVKGWDVLVAEAERQGAIGPESQAQLRHIWRLRNIAIHGPRTTTISKADAEAVLRAAKEMILGEASNLRLRRKG